MTSIKFFGRKKTDITETVKPSTIDAGEMLYHGPRGIREQEDEEGSRECERKVREGEEESEKAEF